MPEEQPKEKAPQTPPAPKKDDGSIDLNLGDLAAADEPQASESNEAEEQAVAEAQESRSKKIADFLFKKEFFLPIKETQASGWRKEFIQATPLMAIMAILLGSFGTGLYVILASYDQVTAVTSETIFVVDRDINNLISEDREVPEQEDNPLLPSGQPEDEQVAEETNREPVKKPAAATLNLEIDLGSTGFLWWAKSHVDVTWDTSADMDFDILHLLFDNTSSPDFDSDTTKSIPLAGQESPFRYEPNQSEQDTTARFQLCGYSIEDQGCVAVSSILEAPL